MTMKAKAMLQTETLFSFALCEFLLILIGTWRKSTFNYLIRLIFTFRAYFHLSCERTLEYWFIYFDIRYAVLILYFIHAVLDAVTTEQKVFSYQNQIHIKCKENKTDRN